jgi:choline-sulfatase
LNSSLGRRDFLKLAGLLSGSALAPTFLRTVPALQPAAGKPNVLIVVFDAFSAYNISLHGYGRETTPNLARLAERAIVYHNHYSGANFTTPGTASLLTGVLPWTHRAFKLAMPVVEAVRSQSIFHAFPNHHRMAYSHNPLVNRLFTEFGPGLDDFIPIERLLLTSDGLVQSLFRRDDDIASLSWVRAMKQAENGGYSYSLFLSRLYQQAQAGRIASAADLFPRGLPYVRGDNYFVLEQAIDFLTSKMGTTPSPFLGYFHFIPPHYPYHTRHDFYDRFKDDGFLPVEKPDDIFGGRRRTPEFLANARREYDEYILYLDHEFGRFFDQLDQSRLLEDTWLVLTSDHGELFERRIWAHTTPVLYQPIVRVPLMIFEPGRRTRTDILTATSAIDLLPTLLQVTGGQPAAWAEGSVLPPFSAAEAADRSIFAVEAKDNLPRQPLTNATLMLVKGRHKLTRFFGYPELGAGTERIELYDLEADPQELNDLYATQPGIGRRMLDELNAKLNDVNLAFR